MQRDRLVSVFPLSFCVLVILSQATERFGPLPRPEQKALLVRGLLDPKCASMRRELRTSGPRLPMRQLNLA